MNFRKRYTYVFYGVRRLCKTRRSDRDPREEVWLVLVLLIFGEVLLADILVFSSSLYSPSTFSYRPALSHIYVHPARWFWSVAAPLAVVNYWLLTRGDAYKVLFEEFSSYSRRRLRTLEVSVGVGTVALLVGAGVLRTLLILPHL